MRTTYRIQSWTGGGAKPHPNAVEAGPPPSEKHAQPWTIDLTPEEVVALSSEYDVMLLGAGETTDLFGQRGPVREMPFIWLDQKGGRFKVR